MAKKLWIGEVTGRIVTTVIIEAESRKEAEAILNGGRSPAIESVGEHITEKSRRVLGRHRPESTDL